ncbi:Metallothionein-like protein type 2 [Morella rubra]|uniref:Metallothionein-like protein n=1 Tax=Morella rubra TaxID=262757 RepID=A0A6A1VSJ4_9ROSI|nr:Metallothionein-like protein type 2 [Morella rubra]
MSSCLGGCGCGSGCKCAGNSTVCGMYPDLQGYSETTTTVTIVAGVAPVKTSPEGSEMSSGAENGCKCGSNCSCNPCNCK